eukprot:TRINITY_DN2134_c0_g1_i3.p1 TRINITY_DN2134_c0_g1~~TRINITY_DN2134_c0_g1_i3.p1  ORF type:complete len:148 (-),score=11.14 TRINITY_DN2134_c0_g1_i3:46-489(-)
MIRRPPRSTLSSSSAASDVYKRQHLEDENSDDKAVRNTDPRLRGRTPHTLSLKTLTLHRSPTCYLQARHLDLGGESNIADACEPSAGLCALHLGLHGLTDGGSHSLLAGLRCGEAGGDGLDLIEEELLNGISLGGSSREGSAGLTER